jgi:membrane protease YdiL (CAAX protease family)
MSLSFFDWLLVISLLALLPLLGIAMHRRVKARVAAGIPGARIAHFGHIIILEWSLVLVTLVIWGFSGRGWEHLGLGLSLDLGWWVGSALALVASGFLVLQWLGLRNDENKLQRMSPEFESLQAMIPHDHREQRWFGAVSISAGICEEIIYRGFLLGVLTALGGAWLGVLVSSLIFGLAHSYQGPKGIAKTAGIGLVAAGITVLTGSLWAAIFLHIVIDITSGLIAQRVMDVSGRSPEGIGAPA